MSDELDAGTPDPVDAGLPPCPLDPAMRQQDGCYPIGYFYTHTQGCILPPGALCFSTIAQPVDDHGHAVDNEWGGRVCHHDDPPAPREPMSTPKKHAEAPAAPAAPVVAAPEATAPAPVEQATKAIVEQPAVTTAAHELSGIIGQDITGMQVVMAVVAVGGGGAAWKFYNQRQKLKHEEKMAELESKKGKGKGDKSERKDDDHSTCNAARVALEARVAAAEAKSATLESKLAALEKKTGEAGEGFDLGDFDPEELEERVKRLEKRLKKLLAKAEDDAEDGE